MKLLFTAYWALRSFTAYARPTSEESFTPLRSSIDEIFAASISDERLLWKSDKSGFSDQSLEDSIRNIYPQLPFCASTPTITTSISTTSKVTPTSCRPLPAFFSPYKDACDSSNASANCGLRTFVPFYGHTVYGPDYSGIDASNCTALRKVWLRSSANWHYNVVNWATATDTWTTTEYDYSTMTFTSGVTSYGSLLTTSSRAFVTSRVDDWNHPKYPISAPCSLHVANEASCASLQSEAQHIDPTGIRGRSSWRDPDRELAPGCTAGCDRCAIRARDAYVLYWPTPAADSTVPTSSAQVVAVHDNKTFTSPTVYVSFGTLEANNNCGPVGQRHHDAIVTLPEDEKISTLEGYAWHWTAKTARSFDFRDLNQPIQADTYRKLIDCGEPTKSCGSPRNNNTDITKCVCPVAIINGYTPKIKFPKAILTVDPTWSDCYLNVYGINESPIPLKPTMIVNHSTASATASPGGSPATAIAFATANPVFSSLDN
jgi:hypothetical protein